MIFDPIQLTFDIADRLSSFAGLAGVKIVSESPRALTPGDVVSNPIDQALAAVSGNGAAIIVLNPDLAGGTTDQPLVFDEAQLEIVCVTSDLINVAPGGAATRAAWLASQVALALHDAVAPPRWWKLAITSMTKIRPETISAEMAALWRDQGLVAWSVKLNTPLVLTALAKCAEPALTELTGTVTITCATSGAAIYYTTDGTYPGSGNTAATLYTVPFPLTTAVALRAAAQKTGLMASDVVEADFTP